MIKIDWRLICFPAKKGLKRVLFSFIMVLFFFWLLTNNKCTYPFDPELDKYDNVLVVDGKLTNLAGSCYVKLTRTYRLNYYSSDVLYKTENDAEVKILDNLNNEIILKDNKDGVYLPPDTNFAGVPSRKYKVLIKTNSGDICESSFEEMSEPVEMRIYWEFKENDNRMNGVQIYVDTDDPLKKSFYYLWDYDETWEFEVPYVSLSAYISPRKNCFKEMSQKSRIMFQSTKNYVDDRITRFPLYFIGDNSNRLSIKYSTLVRQYVLTEKSFEFYRNMKEINEDQGSIYDRTPQILKGNIIDLKDQTKPVLGNFLVSGAYVKRIFISKNELPGNFTPSSEYEACKLRSVSPTLNHNQLLEYDSLRREGWIVMDTFRIAGPNGTSVAWYNMVISKSCFDCTTAGKLTKPSFWN